MKYIAGGLSLYGGRTLVGDATLRSPLTAAGEVRWGADVRNGATFPTARADKRRTYPEFGREAERIHFLVLASELGGRFSDEGRELVLRLAQEKSRNQPPALRGSLLQAYFRRWWGLLSIAVQRAVAQNLLGVVELGSLAPLPGLEELLSLEAELPPASRLM